MTQSFDYIFCTTYWNLLNQFWCLMSFKIFCRCPLKSNLLLLGYVDKLLKRVYRTDGFKPAASLESLDYW